MEHAITSKVTITKSVRDCVTCDMCGMILDVNEDVDDGRTKRFSFRRGTKEHPVSHPTWYHIRYMHHDWGNDSTESTRSLDYCTNCAAAYMISFLGDSSTTKEIEVEAHEGTVPVDMIPALLEKYSPKFGNRKSMTTAEVLGLIIPHVSKEDGVFAAANALFEKMDQ